MPAPSVDDARWLFLTTHAHILVQVAREPDSTVRALAERVGVTERQAHRVLADLVAGGYLERSRVGRRNTYRVERRLPFRHPAFAEHEIGELLEVLN